MEKRGILNMRFRSAVVNEYNRKCLKNIKFSHPELPVYKLCVLGAKFIDFVRTDRNGAVISILLPEFYDRGFFKDMTHNDVVCFVQESLFNFIRSDDEVFNVQVIYGIDHGKFWTQDNFFTVDEDWNNKKFSSRTEKPRYQEQWAYSHPDLKTTSLIDFYFFLLAGKDNML